MEELKGVGSRKGRSSYRIPKVAGNNINYELGLFYKLKSLPSLLIFCAIFKYQSTLKLKSYLVKNRSS